MNERMSKTSATLLLSALKDLEALEIPPTASFAMNTWGSHDAGHNPVEQNYCGTSACALGWLSTIPKWADLGLRGKWVKQYNDEDPLYSHRPVDSGTWETAAWGVFKIGRADVTALFMTWFGLDTKELYVEAARIYIGSRMTGQGPSAARLSVSDIMHHRHPEIEDICEEPE